MKRIILGGVAAAVTLTFAAASVTSPTSAALLDASSPAGACPQGGARLAEGATASDPNSISQAQAKAMNRALHERLQAMSPRAHHAALVGAIPVTVKINWQVITRNDGTGGVTNSQLRRQLKVMNDSYSGLTGGADTRFSFITNRIIRTANTNWWNWNPNTDDAPAKNALHKGTKRVLNVYIASLSGGLLGYATFPGGPVTLDGVVILNQSLPGGNAAPFNKGDTLTHEAGHWFGLFHTFQGGCSAPNDFVADTPQQDDGPNIFSCDTTLDTCSAPGRDPIHNFMNYAADPCLNRFTAGQASRMSAQWDAFRA
ncbi:MAG: zinc metalloprotease [Gaiellales bacterium]